MSYIPSVAEQKQQLRDAIVERIEHTPKEQRDAEGKSISRRLLEEIPTGSTVLAYWALKTEPSVRLCIETLLKRGDPVYLPCFTDLRTTCRQLQRIEDLQPGPIKIYEPPNDAPILDSATLDIALIPGRAFDHSMHRLGRGAGGFDRWIAKQRTANPGTRFLGVCFESQLLREIPHEDHDKNMDGVVTARGLIQ